MSKIKKNTTNKASDYYIYSTDKLFIKSGIIYKQENRKNQRIEYYDTIDTIKEIIKEDGAFVNQCKQNAYRSKTKWDIQSIYNYAEKRKNKYRWLKSLKPFTEEYYGTFGLDY